MEVMSLCSSTFLPSLSRSDGRRITSVSPPMRRRLAVSAAIKRSNSYGSGRQVDESLIVLRKRIHEMKVVERNYQPPADWMEWEKQIYAGYDDIICRLLGIVQAQLMESRPSVAIAVLALVGASVPTSVVLLSMQIASAVASAAGQ